MSLKFEKLGKILGLITRTSKNVYKPRERLFPSRKRSQKKKKKIWKPRKDIGVLR